MIKEHLVSASVTNGAECICNPEVLLGTKYGLWDFQNEIAPKGTLLDLNAAWELFLSRNGFSNVSFETHEHRLHEVIDGVVYNEGDTTYILLDDNGNPTGATFTIKANKGPIEHIEWEKGKLILYYTKLRPLEDKDILPDNVAPIHYVTDEDGVVIHDEETGKPLVYDYVTIPVMEIFDNDETRQLFPWYSDENNVTQLRDSIDGRTGHLGSIAITPESEVYVAKNVDSDKNLDLISVLSVLKQLEKDLGFEQSYEKATDYPDPDDGEYHTYRASGSNLSEKLHNGIGNKSSLVSAINEDLVRTRINTRLLADKIVESNLDWKNLLEFADSIKNQAFSNSTVPNILAALNWIQEAEIGPFKETINPSIFKEIQDGDDTLRITVENITEALNVIFEEAENNKDRIGYDKVNRLWKELNTDNNETLTEALNEVDLHANALADAVGVDEKFDTVHKSTYYSTDDTLNSITRTRSRITSSDKSNVTIVEALNEIQSLIGNLSESKSNNTSIPLLNTDIKNSLVEAINEVDLHTDNNEETIGAEYNKDITGKKTGEITNLETDDKSSIVNAINELSNRAGDLDNLDTENKESIVDAVNEVIAEQPFNYQDVNNPKESGVILKDRENSAEDGSLALGEHNNIGKFSLAVGVENKSLGNYTIINGATNTAKLNLNLISGKSNTIDGRLNLVNGQSNVVIGSENIVSGYDNTVTVAHSEILGSHIIAKNSTNIGAIGDTLIFKDNIQDSFAIGKDSKISGDNSYSIGYRNNVSEDSITIGHGNATKGPNNVAIGDYNEISCDSSYTFGNANITHGDHTYVIGENNQEIEGDNNYVFGNKLKVKGNNNIVIGKNNKVGETDKIINNAIVIGEFNEPQSNSTNIGKEIFIQTHNTESNLQKLIFVDLNDWCKNNNSASLNGEKFLDVQHLVNAIKVYKSKNYEDKALLRFTMLDNNENGFVIIQGKSTRIYLNGTWYFSDNIELGWSRHEGEYLKVINKVIVDNTGRQITKHYLALMDLLSTDAIVDTVGGQRSNTEDFSTIDLSHAYGAVDLDDVEEALDLINRFNSKVDKSAKIITKYQDGRGVYSEKVLNFIDTDNSAQSSNITLDLKESFGFDKFDYQLKSEKGAPNGYAPLDGGSKVPAEYLPSYVDDVIDVWAEYKVDDATGSLSKINLYEVRVDLNDATQTPEVHAVNPLTPITGERGKIYVEANPKLEGHIAYQFRWTGTQFVVIGAHLVLGEVKGTAYDGGKGKELRDEFDLHWKSGITYNPVYNLDGTYALDENGNQIWLVYNPNPHHVTAEQLEVSVNDPNDPTNIDLLKTYNRNYNVETAIQELFRRINEDEDNQDSTNALLGTVEDREELDSLNEVLGDENPTVIRQILNNREEIKSFKTISSSTIENLVSTYFKLYEAPEKVISGDDEVDDDF